MSKVPEYYSEMSDKTFLKLLDEYGDAHYCIHEAARRIRKLKQDLTQQKDSGGCVHNVISQEITITECARCGAFIVKKRT